MTEARAQIIESLSDREYRHALARQFRRRMIAFQLRAIRKSQKLSQTKLGEMVGMTQTSISELETPGLRSPNIETLERLAEVLDVDYVSHFGRFGRLASRIAELSQSDLAVPSYDQEFAPWVSQSSQGNETRSNISQWRGTSQAHEAQPSETGMFQVSTQEREFRVTV